MKIINSICTSLVFPESRKKISAFSDMAAFLASKGVKSIEFYHDGDGRDKTGNVLSDNGLEGIYIAVIPSKEGKLHLCDTNEEGRQAAIKLYQSCIDEAQANGIGRVMMNSGWIQEDVNKGLDALSRSVTELYEYAAKKNYKNFSLTMEPCDSWMDAHQLVGPYARTLEFTKKLHEQGVPLELTMDSAHTVEEGEDFFEAVKAVKPYCKHIHFANCNITDKDSPLYGDKHVGFEFPHTEWTGETLGKLTEQLEGLYTGDDELRIAIEVLCREEDPYAYFEKLWAQVPFIHKGF